MSHSAPAATVISPGAVDYIIVVSNEDDYHAGFHHFAEKVNRKLRAGYQLHGQAFAVSQTMCQAMVRHGDGPSGSDTTVFKKTAGPHS